MKITTKKCLGCGRKVQYIQHADGSGWFNSHKNRRGELCDEKPKNGRIGLWTRFSRWFGKQEPVK